MKIIFAVVLSLFAYQTHANGYKVGKLTQVNLKLNDSPLEFKYDVFYYFPRSAKDQENLKSLVFLHGGGQSTTTRAGSAKVVTDYAKDLIKISEELGILIIFPSGSGLNWGSHTISYLKDVNRYIRKTFPVDPHRIALSGHSMGGMGITRTAHWLVDEYAFFMPVAAGMEDSARVDRYLKPYFNLNFYHLQGLKDHFQIFVTRSEEVKKHISSLERRFDRHGNYTLELYDGDHNIPLSLYQQRLKEQFAKHSRNLYQKELFGIFYYSTGVTTDDWSNGNNYFLAPRDRYFWVRALNFTEEKKTISFEAKMDGQTITLNTFETGLSRLRFYLSKKMLNLDQPIEIIVNDVTYFEGKVKIQKQIMELEKDPSFVFDSYVDVSI